MSGFDRYNSVYADVGSVIGPPRQSYITKACAGSINCHNVIGPKKYVQHVIAVILRFFMPRPPKEGHYKMMAGVCPSSVRAST